MYYGIIKRKIKRWCFTWNAEPEEEGGSIVFTLFKVIHFLKYKESTLIYFGKKKEYQPARKYVEAFNE